MGARVHTCVDCASSVLTVGSTHSHWDKIRAAASKSSADVVLIANRVPQCQNIQILEEA